MPSILINVDFSMVSITSSIILTEKGFDDLRVFGLQGMERVLHYNHHKTRSDGQMLATKHSVTPSVDKRDVP